MSAGYRRCAFISICLAVVVPGPRLLAQKTQPPAADDRSITVHGTVVNSINKTPVSRALVRTPGNESATMTDDEGHFTFQIHLSGPKPVPGRRAQVTSLVARKNGYLEGASMAVTEYVSDSGSTEEADVTINLVPEAIITGHAIVPGSAGEVRLDCILLKREMRNGKASWATVQPFKTWSDGEFRFAGLKPGSYRLITQQKMDEESKRSGGQEYGYPPVYYPNTRNFSDAADITVGAGETARVDLTAERVPYFPVEIAVKNAPSKSGLVIDVWAGDGRGPGWTLDYDGNRQVIEGSLPAGSYTVRAITFKEDENAVGEGKFAVQNRPLQGAILVLSPSARISVNVRENLLNRQSGPRNIAYLSMSLLALDSAPLAQDEWPASSGFGSTGQNWEFSNVPPGKYALRVRTPMEYLASADSGGSDLLHEPLVIGQAASVLPISLTMRDDGAEVDVVADDSGAEGGGGQDSSSSPQSLYVVLLPISEWNQGPITMAGPVPARVMQIPPGDYLALAFTEAPPDDLPYGNAAAMQKWTGLGETIHVDVGQKSTLKLKPIPGAAE